MRNCQGYLGVKHGHVQGIFGVFGSRVLFHFRAAVDEHVNIIIMYLILKTIVVLILNNSIIWNAQL